MFIRLHSKNYQILLAMDNNSQARMYNMTDYYIGLGLALSSSGFIGMYFMLLRSVMLKLNSTTLKICVIIFSVIIEIR